MILFKRKRAEGKTTALIHTSAVTGYPIIVSTIREAKLVLEMADKLGLRIPEPVTYFEHKRIPSFVRQQGLLVDNLDHMLPDILNHYFDGNVVSATMSIGDN